MPGLRIDRGGVVEELARVLVPHDPRQFGRRVVKLEIADKVRLAGREQLLLHIADRHGLRDQLDAHLRGGKHLRHRGRRLVLQRVGV